MNLNNKSPLSASPAPYWPIIFAATALALSVAGNALALGPTATITFNERDWTLTSDSREALAALVKQGRAKGQIDEIQVAVWSDNPAPRDTENLSQPDRELASRRLNVVEEYLSQNQKISVKGYNMAERASWLARFFETSDAELKAEIGRGGDGVLSKNAYQVFKANGRPLRAVALVVLKR